LIEELRIYFFRDLETVKKRKVTFCIKDLPWNRLVLIVSVLSSNVYLTSSG